jgi:hypothetical protein
MYETTIPERDLRAMTKTQLLARINAERARFENPLSPLTGDDHTKKDLIQLAYDYATPEVNAKEKSPSTVSLLKQLNVILTMQKKPTLKAWKGSRAQLLERIAKAKSDTAHVTPTKCKPGVADGIEVHKAPSSKRLLKAVQTQDKKTSREILKQQKEMAHWLSEPNPYKTSDVLRWVQVSGYVKNADLPSDYEEKLGAFIEALPKAKRGAHHNAAPRAKKINGNHFTPSDIASELKREPRSIRIWLRKNEKKVSKFIDADAGRWAFKIDHKAKVLAAIKGDK